MNLNQTNQKLDLNQCAIIFCKILIILTAQNSYGRKSALCCAVMIPMILYLIFHQMKYLCTMEYNQYDPKYILSRGGKQFKQVIQADVLLSRPQYIMEADNQNNPAEPLQRRETSPRGKQFLFFIIIYLLFTMSGNFSIKKAPFNKNIVNAMRNSEGQGLSVEGILNIFATNSYYGKWVLTNPGTQRGLQKETGRMALKLFNYGSAVEKDYYFEFQLNNGEYIDDGAVFFYVYIDTKTWESSQNGTHFTVQPMLKDQNNQTHKVSAAYKSEHILKTVEEAIIELEDIWLTVRYVESDESEDNVEVKMEVKSEKLSAEFWIQGVESRNFATISFAVVIFVVSFMEFSAIMGMLRILFEGQESANNYSIMTVLVATMWDATLCIVSFIYAFRDEEYLILFILPAFVLCLLFTNLELRLMLLIFQARFQNTNIREVVCKFNLTAYGGLLLIYPILVYTNLSNLFFLTISLLFLPQIYHNGMIGHRPSLDSPYYSRFLLVRFLLIYYLKGFPWNIFQFKPDYLLIIVSAALVGLQLFLVWVQNRYGPKKIIPKFLLPPVYDYACDVELNLEEGVEDVLVNQPQGDKECVICLLPLHANSEQVLPYQIPSRLRLMKAPCNHCFHGACLIKWMEIKMECPQCRSRLPPYQ